jgi:hypothetical protein
MRILPRLSFPTDEEIEVASLHVLNEGRGSEKIIRYARRIRFLCHTIAFIFMFFLVRALADPFFIFIRERFPWWVWPMDLFFALSTGLLFRLVFRVERKFREVGL